MAEPASINTQNPSVSPSALERMNQGVRRSRVSEDSLADMDRYEAFSQVLSRLNDGKQITFTPDNVYRGDRFLIFSGSRQSQTVTFRRRRDGVWVMRFDGDEPMLLENAPESFWKSIIKNS